MKWPLASSRRERPPAEGTEPLDPDERVLAWASAAGGAVVATPRGLWLPGADRMPWHLITHVVWSGTTLTATGATEVEPSVLENDPPRSVRLTEPRDLPEVVEKRFYSSRAHTDRHRLSTGGGVVIVARRVPGRDGLSWYAVYDDPAQRQDETARREVAALLRQTRDFFQTG